MRKPYSSRITVALALFMAACTSTKKAAEPGNNVLTPISSTAGPAPSKNEKFSLANPVPLQASTLINYARQFLGTPYLYASADPQKGFDCSGFLFHVFQHFNISSPRASYDFEFKGRPVDVSQAKPGDLVLFTGSDDKKIGHIGLIIETMPAIKFIHASSARSGGVIISTLSGYYREHLVKINRILAD